MNVSRRSFLGGLLTVAAVAAVPSSLKLLDLPLLTGDGVADDTDAIQAMIEGRPFRTIDGFAGIAGQGTLRGARFLISRTIKVTQAAHLVLRDCEIIFEPDRDDLVFDVSMNGLLVLDGSTITGRKNGHEASTTIASATYGGQVIL